MAAAHLLFLGTFQVHFANLGRSNRFKGGRTGELIDGNIDSGVGEPDYCRLLKDAESILDQPRSNHQSAHECLLLEVVLVSGKGGHVFDWER